MNNLNFRSFADITIKLFVYLCTKNYHGLTNINHIYMIVVVATRILANLHHMK